MGGATTDQSGNDCTWGVVCGICWDATAPIITGAALAIMAVICCSDWASFASISLIANVICCFSGVEP